jgi:hypothetical protein
MILCLLGNGAWRHRSNALIDDGLAPIEQVARQILDRKSPAIDSVAGLFWDRLVFTVPSTRIYHKLLKNQEAKRDPGGRDRTCIFRFEGTVTYHLVYPGSSWPMLLRVHN